MRRFRSPADRPLALARQQERLAELLVARANSQLAQAATQVAAAAEHERTAANDFAAALCRPGVSLHLASLQQHVAAAGVQVAQRSLAQEHAVTAQAAARERLRACRARSESLARLQSRHIEHWQHERLREESREIDEHAARRHHAHEVQGASS